MKYRIKVTQEHIESGSNWTHACPVALAIKEATPFAEVSVIPSFIGIRDSRDTQVSVPTSEPVRAQIAEYDRCYPRRRKDPTTGYGMTPFEFDLEVPEAAK